MLAEVDARIMDLHARLQAGAMSHEEFLGRLGEEAKERARVAAMITLPAPRGDRFMHSLKAFVDTWLSFEEPRA